MGSGFDESSIKSFFVIEAQEYVENLEKSLSEIKKNPKNNRAFKEIQKTTHTLKGSSAMMGFNTLSKLSLYLETMMKGIRKDVLKNNNVEQTVSHILKLMKAMLKNITEGKSELNVELLRSNVEFINGALKNYTEEFESKRKKTAETRVQEQVEIEEKEISSQTKNSEEILDAPEDLREQGDEIERETVSDVKETETETREAETEKIAPSKKPPDFSEDDRVRSPKESDFFLPTSETTRLQPDTKSVRDSSFLDLIPDIKESFILEATDHLQNIDHLLLDWESNFKDEKLTTSLMRAAHSLKGSANTVGFVTLGELAHRMEDIIEGVRSGKLDIQTDLVDTLFESVDLMKLLVKSLEDEETETKALVDRITKQLNKILSEESIETAEKEKETAAEGEKIEDEEPVAESETLIIEEDGEKKEESEAAPFFPSLGIPEAQKEELKTTATAKTPTTGPMKTLDEDDLAGTADTLTQRISLGETEKQIVRVHINQLDMLMNLVGELVINRSKLDKRADIFKMIGDEIDFSRGRLQQVIEEFTDKYEFSMPSMDGVFKSEGEDDFGALEFDKYDDFNILSRSLMEIGSDVVEIMNQLKEFLTSFDEEIDEMGGAITHLQEEITRSRMVAVGRLFRRFSRTVRDIANKEEKTVQLMIMGEDTEIDKTVIEEMADPMMHLVRNAVTHGIESPEERVRLGKQKQGTVLLNAYPEGNSIVIEVEDDGAGLDLNAIKNRAIQMGLLTEEAAESVSQNVLIDFIFTPGFTTTLSTTDISGRGVGLDVVRENILHLGGSIMVQTERNIGTRFIIKLPLTLAITQALMVEASGYQFALPLNAVEETIVIDRRQIETAEEQEVIEIRDKKIPFMRLQNLLMLPPSKSERRFIPAVILGSTEANAALLVDDLLGQEEIVVKQLGSFLDNLRYFSGATITGDGQVVLILDPAYMAGFEELSISVTSTMESTLKERVIIEEPEPIEEKETKGSLLLVDDSISIRKFVGKLLENAGYTVDVAIDGLEALSKVESTRYNLIITDLEMPRMHGYEFITELKRDETLKSLPVIVLTSRAGEKHKRKAMSKGADGYVVKPFNEEILLDSINRLL